ncbi:hypothetical protein OG985_45055 [Streptomyces sp. NBC_00289]|uniref:hypothetical protein n=1 Tax=Streptomyces sp. NBC_00289 TaxID=2975703 RepID=UPI003248B5D5
MSVVIGMGLAILIGLAAMASCNHLVRRLNALRDRRAAPTDLDICQGIAAASSDHDHRA